MAGSNVTEIADDWNSFSKGDVNVYEYGVLARWEGGYTIEVTHETWQVYCVHKHEIEQHVSLPVTLSEDPTEIKRTGEVRETHKYVLALAPREENFLAEWVRENCFTSADWHLPTTLWTSSRTDEQTYIWLRFCSLSIKSRPFVRIGSPHPLSRKRVCFPPGTKGGGGATLALLWRRTLLHVPLHLFFVMEHHGLAALVVQYKNKQPWQWQWQCVAGRGGGVVLSCVGDHILQEFNTQFLTRFRT
jgi:hypothetical protein